MDQSINPLIYMQIRDDLGQLQTRVDAEEC